MLSPNATPTPITPPRVPLIDLRTGLIDRAWYMFFLSLMNAAMLVYEDNVEPNSESLLASYEAALQALAQNVDTQPLPVDLSAELTKQIEAAGLTDYATNLLSQIAEMQKQLEALNIVPLPTQGTVVAVTGTAPVVSTGGIAPNISMASANTSTNGYLTSTDWNTFNNKQAALVSGTNIKTVNGTTLLGSGDVGTITYAYGGTGQTSVTTGDLLYGSATNTWSKLADVATGNALISGGVGVVPSYGKIGLTTHVNGTLPTANGGTNLTSFTANGVVYASSTSALTTGSGLTFNGTTLSVGGGINVAPAAGVSSLDSSSATVTLVVSATQTFPSASGMLMVTSFTTGSTYLYICGGGGTIEVSHVGASIGTFSFNGTSYVFTNTTFVSQTYGFMFLRTRNSP